MIAQEKTLIEYPFGSTLYPKFNTNFFGKMEGGNVMRRKKGQIVEIKRIGVEIEEIRGCFPAPIIARGNSFYVKLDPDFIHFWELKQGDELLVTVTQVKREIRHEEKGSNLL